MPQLPESLSFNDVGGTKNEYTAVVDSSTDRSADEVNSAFCAIAEATRTVDRGWLRFVAVADGYTPALVSSSTWNTVWKGGTATSPVFGHPSTGVVTITLPTTVNDEQGVSHTVNVQGVTGNIEGSTFGFINCDASSNVITVRTANTAGSANNLTGSTIYIEWK